MDCRCGHPEDTRAVHSLANCFFPVKLRRRPVDPEWFREFIVLLDAYELALKYGRDGTNQRSALVDLAVKRSC